MHAKSPGRSRGLYLLCPRSSTRLEDTVLPSSRVGKDIRKSTSSRTCMRVFTVSDHHEVYASASVCKGGLWCPSVSLMLHVSILSTYPEICIIYCYHNAISPAVLTGQLKSSNIVLPAPVQCQWSSLVTVRESVCHPSPKIRVSTVCPEASREPINNSGFEPAVDRIVAAGNVIQMIQERDEGGKCESGLGRLDRADSGSTGRSPKERTQERRRKSV